MFTIHIPFPKREQRRKKFKKPAASKKPADGRGPAAAAAAKPRPRPQWDATTTDLDKHRLTPAEMEFRRSLRSRHRLPRPASQTSSQPGGEGLALRLPLEEQGQDEEGWRGGSADPLPASGPEGAGGFCNDEGEEGSDGSGTASLASMRVFVAQLQAKYALGGAAGEAGDKDAPAPTSAGGMLGPAAAAVPPAQRKPSLAQLLEQELERQAAELGAASDDEEGGAGGGGAWHALSGAAAGGREGLGVPASVGPQPDGSDSEGEGHLGPAALRRAQRRRQQAATAGAAAAMSPAGPAPGAGCAPGEQKLAARLAAAEAQLGRYSGLEASLARTQAEVDELRQQNAQLQNDLNEFVGHTGTLLTSLQLQLSSFLAGQGGSSGERCAADLAAAGRLQPLSPAARASAVPAAVAQARAASEAVAIPQQAHARSAALATAAAPSTEAAEVKGEAGQPAPAAPAAAAPTSEWRPAWEDALADVQLPSFRSFARQQGLAAAAPKPAPIPRMGAVPALDPRWAAGWADREGCEENSPPQPRALPSGLQQWSAGAAAGGFEWRPMGAASSAAS